MESLKSHILESTYESYGKTIIFFIFILLFFNTRCAVYNALFNGETIRRQSL